VTGERKQEILQAAIEIIADEGYSSLSMRSLARASGMKLGALQYHFRTWEDLLRSLVGYIDKHIREAFEAQNLQLGSASVTEIVEFMLTDTTVTEDALFGDKLWPQLWAMEQVEPLVSDLLEEVYADYLEILEKAMAAAGSESPGAEALCVMSLTEGESLFMGQGRRWEQDRSEVRKTMLKFIEIKYGENS